MPNTRPPMFNFAAAKVIWALVPIATINIGAAIPFVVAAVKGVIKPWIAVVYVVAEVLILGIGTVVVRPNEESPLVGFPLIATSATHTALLDNDNFRIWK
ncbi:hypothetical protein OG883_25540 [Streptomyces sp. NBC_01142]|uniref:hypothetical protein n=1 Tax=Streptomyces sp. NBC_01142 TaxID=2975865 RepID=UPI002258CFBE|nr:hypothetical protein [Streptomyces sp. NBC_01142]MCX4823191.1 hypothetical protein [Streptomyces sp. NBC_01142]